VALGGSGILALLLLPLAPVASFGGYPLCPISIFFSIPVRSAQFGYCLRCFLSHLYIWSPL